MMQIGKPFTLKSTRQFTILLGCLLTLVAADICTANSSTADAPTKAESKISWEKNMQKALTHAQSEGKPVLLDFFSPL